MDGRIQERLNGDEIRVHSARMLVGSVGSFGCQQSCIASYYCSRFFATNNLNFLNRAVPIYLLKFPLVLF